MLNLIFMGKLRGSRRRTVAAIKTIREMQDATTVLSIVSVPISRTIEDKQNTGRAGIRKVCRVVRSGRVMPISRCH